MSYNGWSNYPTWNVALWLGNEPATYEDSRRITRENAHKGRSHVADALRDYVEELAGEPLTEASFVADLLGHAIGEVDWFELADSMMDEDESSESGRIDITTVGILLMLAGFAYLAAHIVAFAMRAVDTVRPALGG